MTTTANDLPTLREAAAKATYFQLSIIMCGRQVLVCGGPTHFWLWSPATDDVLMENLAAPGELRATEVKEGRTRFDFGNAMLLFWESPPVVFPALA